MQGDGQSQAKTEEELSHPSLNLGPPLPSEISKPPWRPKAAGVIAFFFGPIAGALVVAGSLRRMGYPERAKKVIQLALGVAVLEAATLFCVPDGLDRLVGFGAEIAFMLVFPAFTQRQFYEWQAAHSNDKPCNGWSAIGLGLLGTVLLLLIVFLVFFGLYLVFPGHK